MSKISTKYLYQCQYCRRRDILVAFQIPRLFTHSHPHLQNISSDLHELRKLRHWWLLTHQGGLLYDCARGGGETLVDTVQSVITSSRRHLRSSETTDYVKRTTRTKFRERGFSHSGPAAWNSLPSHLRTIIDTDVFKRHLKAFLFTESFA